MNQTWRSKVLTLFPEMFPGPLGVSLAGQALKDGLWSCETLNIRDHATDKHRTVDDAPFGGGPGMVMRPDVLDAALDAALEDAAGLPLLITSARGVALTQARVRDLAEGPGLIVLCGRYEGVDQRVIEARGLEEVSLGDVVLSGGEPAALALLDACVRLLPGVMGKEGSGIEESFESGLLEYPHYTRPQVWQGRAVPDVLVSGHHENIRRWRTDEAEAATRSRRPDLWERYVAKNG
ncbi:MAG: tRNA (guanosine(37)-N1)-methyltransferase TrmD [Magnetovibrio sp.]|nr:tRNA (guanosine(37)-N1)-methyltransferase TrmD [Magnetovibrio sp.]